MKPIRIIEQLNESVEDEKYYRVAVIYDDGDAENGPNPNGFYWYPVKAKSEEEARKITINDCSDDYCGVGSAIEISKEEYDRALTESADDASFKKAVLDDFNLFIEEKYDAYSVEALVDQLEHVSEEDVNDFFSSKFYDIETEEDLDDMNKAEEIIRAEYGLQDKIEESSDYIDVYVVYNNQDGPYETFDDEEDAEEAKKEYEEERPECRWWVNKEQKSTR